MSDPITVHEYYGTKRVRAYEALGPVAVEGVKPEHPGYVTLPPGNTTGQWIPKAAFDAVYQRTDAMGFGHALAALMAGDRVARPGWTASISLVDGTTLTLSAGVGAASPMTWRPTSIDLLADDWKIVP